MNMAASIAVNMFARYFPFGLIKHSHLFRRALPSQQIFAPPSQKPLEKHENWVLIWKSCLPITSLKCYSTLAQDREGPEPDVLYRQVELELKGHDEAVIKSYVTFLEMAANELGIFIANTYTPMKVFDRLTVLKSAFVHKKHRVQYEMRTHFRLVRLKHLTGSTCNTYLEYVQRNLPEGIAMKVTRYKLETLASHLKPPSGPDEPSAASERAVTPNNEQQQSADVDTNKANRD